MANQEIALRVMLSAAVVICLGVRLAADAPKPGVKRALQAHEALTIAVVTRNVESLDYKISAERSGQQWVFLFQTIQPRAGGHFAILVSDDGRTELRGGR